MDGGKRGGEVQRGVEEEETLMRIHYVRRKIYFQLKGKKSFNEKQLNET